MPAGQAPDDVLKKLSDVVHAGKYAEAQQTITAMLILYPDDQRLIKANPCTLPRTLTPLFWSIMRIVMVEKSVSCVFSTEAMGSNPSLSAV